LDVAALRASVLEYQETALKHVLPMFTTQLPDAYFKHISVELQQDHLRAITALHGSGKRNLPTKAFSILSS
jgi:hypothetical protein